MNTYLKYLIVTFSGVILSRILQELFHIHTESNTTWERVFGIYLGPGLMGWSIAWIMLKAKK